VKILTIAPEIAGRAGNYRSRRGGQNRRGAWAIQTPPTIKRAPPFRQARATPCISTTPCAPSRIAIPASLGAILTDPEVTAEVIADGVHVAGPAIQVLIGAKGFDAVLLVSDGIAATGMPDGNYRLGNFEVT
jgi:hypothetical protein